MKIDAPDSKTVSEALGPCGSCIVFIRNLRSTHTILHAREGEAHVHVFLVSGLVQVTVRFSPTER